MPDTARRPMLSSERIRSRFGSYGVDVLACDERHRVSSLYSRSGGEKICRSYAKVRFNLPLDPACAAAHARVLGGESIGAVFQSAGWAIERRHLYVGEAPLPAQDREIARLMRIEGALRLATHTYDFRIAKNGVCFDYARITERHHPDYLSAADLLAIYRLEPSPAGDDDPPGR